MKKFFFFLIIFLPIAHIAPAQYFVWLDPVPVTDSVAYNRNISLTDMFSPSYDSIYCVWERSVDASSTAIYGRNLATMSEPFGVIAQPNVHFLHPTIFNWAIGDTIFLVIYQTNLYGNYDICYSKYMKNGVTTQPVPICNSSADEINYSYNPNRGIVWEQEGAIYFKNYMIGAYPSPVITTRLDTGNCHRPVLSSQSCEWEKIVGTDTVIMSSLYDFGSSSWSDPVELCTGKNTNLSVGDGFGTVATWQSKEDNLWRLKFADAYFNIFYSVNDFSGANNVDPTFSNVMIVTKQPAMPPSMFYSFASDVTGNYEVYANENPSDSVYINISNHPTINRHPQFYNSWLYTPWCQTVFLFWESWRNNHWQIWMSHLDIPEGIKNNEPVKGLMKIFPNPSNGAVTIRYRTTGESRSGIIIYNALGVTVRSLATENGRPGIHKVTWDGNDVNGHRVSPGIYHCTLDSDGKIISGNITIL
jgi:hypothetical protein